MTYSYDSSDESSSFISTDTSWMDSSSDDSEVQALNEPEFKKRKKSHTIEKDFVETELNCDLVLRANYKCSIKDFSKICEECKIGEKLESPIFTVGPNEELKWRLQLYPRGNNEQNKNHLSLYFYLVSCKEGSLKVQYKCTLAHKKIPNVAMQGEEYFIEGQHFGFKRFRKSDDAFKSLIKKLENDKLTFICDINAHLSKSFVNKIKVVNDLEVLLDSGDYSDVTLEVENKQFKVHKYILAARSPVFAAMFKHDMKEKQQNIVEIFDIDSTIMKELLRFTYTGAVENLDSIAKDLLAAADKYAFEDLKIMCENALCKSLSIENVVEILNFAELHNAVKLKDQSLEFFVTHIKKVIDSPAFKLMGDTQSPLLAQIIRIMATQ